VKDREGERVDNAEPSVPPNYTAVQTHANPENKLYLLCKLAAYWRTERTGFVTTRVRDGGGERGWNLRGVEARDQSEGGRENERKREEERERERDYRGSIAYFESSRWCTHHSVNTAYCRVHTVVRKKYIYLCVCVCVCVCVCMCAYREKLRYRRSISAAKLRRGRKVDPIRTR